MTKFLLSVHVLAAILAVGPVAVAASMFAPAVRAALAAPGDGRPVAVVRTLHRVCRVYTAVGVFVPVFGFATAKQMGVLTDAWLIASMVVTAVAAAVLAGLVIPGQQAVLARVEEAAATGVSPVGATASAAGATASPADATAPAADGPEPGPATRTVGTPAPDGGEWRQAVGRLGAYAGVFNLLWAVVTVLMIVRPGSTTGA